MTTELHVLFGAGQVGHTLARQLLAAGKRVRIAKRVRGLDLAGVEVALGDAVDPAFSLRALVDRFALALGREIGLRVMPRWATHVLGFVVPILREIDEMQYQWEEPFVVDDRRFRERFGSVPTDMDVAARETVDWARRAYAPR